MMYNVYVLNNIPFIFYLFKNVFENINNTLHGTLRSLKRNS